MANSELLYVYDVVEIEWQQVRRDVDQSRADLNSVHGGTSAGNRRTQKWPFSPGRPMVTAIDFSARPDAATSDRLPK